MVFVSFTIKENQPNHSTTDNIDLQVDTPDGKRQLPGTESAVY